MPSTDADPWLPPIARTIARILRHAENLKLPCSIHEHGELAVASWLRTLDRLLEAHGSRSGDCATLWWAADLTSQALASLDDPGRAGAWRLSDDQVAAYSRILDDLGGVPHPVQEPPPDPDRIRALLGLTASGRAALARMPDPVEVEPPAAEPPTAEPPADDDLTATLDRLRDSPRSRDLVAYLVGIETRQAHLDRIAIDLDRAHRDTADRRRATIRKRLGRARRLLDERQSPYRLDIDRNVVRLIRVRSSTVGTG